MRLVKKLPQVALVLALLAPLPGCLVLAAAAGAGAVYGAMKYVNNEASQEFAADIGSTWKATVASMQANGYLVDTDIAHGPTEGEIRMDDAVVHVEAVGNGVTRVTVRVGTFETDENERRAKLIVSGVAERLS